MITYIKTYLQLLLVNVIKTRFAGIKLAIILFLIIFNIL